MHVETFDVPGPTLLRPVRHKDDRGYLSETFHTTRFLEAAGVIAKKERSNPNKAVPGKKAQERAAEKAEKAAAAEEAASEE